MIEDEHLAAAKLAQLIHRYDPGIQILDEIDTVEESIEWLQQNPPPDLLFMDIHLADGSSFEIFNQVQVKSPIIFTTAYDKYAIQAFRTKSIDYLLKPIKYADFERAMHKFKEMFQRPTGFAKQEDLSDIAYFIRNQAKTYKNRFLIKVGNQIKSVSITEIAYFVFEDRTTLLVTKEGRRYPIKENLDLLEEKLNPLHFARANRQFIVGIDAIKKNSPLV